MKLATAPLKFSWPALLLFAGSQTELIQHVGPLETGGHLTATHQLLRPACQSVELGGRPVDLVLAPNGRTVYVKDNRGLVVIDAETWKVRQELKFPQGGGSTHGLAVTRDGSRLFASTAQNALWEANMAADGKVVWGKKIVLPGFGNSTNVHVGGIGLSRDETKAYVCLSRRNSLAVVDLGSTNLLREIPVGVAPFDVVVQTHPGSGEVLYVSNWGGRLPKTGEKTAKLIFGPDHDDDDD
ncbi:MAG: hypothetical protein FJ403_10550 [Verrucomicrobia bacterium]|nr:hypothetical protein [Verrucomicrobiota bacterium]